MIIELVSICIITTLIIVFYYKSRPFFIKNSQISKILEERFKIAKKVDFALHQPVFLYENNSIFKYLFEIRILQRFFDPFYLLYPSEEQIILVGEINKPTNCFIFKRNKTITHLGLKLVPKQKGEFTNYKVYGNKIFYKFCVKYNVNIFYISYLPKKFEKNPEFRCNFFLQMDCNYKNFNPMIEELFLVLEALQGSDPSKIDEMKSAYYKAFSKKEVKLRVKQRDQERIKERQNSNKPYDSSKKDKKKLKNSRKITFKK
ncbi:hypothetical protein EDEG_00279 [Edhazardia aedis USNM 41457]|uniref:Uncharacterized protein n=1 Tax=Edhazardia aedis (strain USNM 41457) TaxID=1003232 RepID=J8ZRV2_EDHAE|nr:hypothetical protein EDEG_00279 [Edhazardia aedis USNM 41457]|eukprot:EJW02423.1 hypothetical protein EDEG_00279 [Edhazardia aedis USNM 41457]